MMSVSTISKILMFPTMLVFQSNVYDVLPVVDAHSCLTFIIMFFKFIQYYGLKIYIMLLSKHDVRLIEFYESYSFFEIMTHEQTNVNKISLLS